LVFRVRLAGNEARATAAKKNADVTKRTSRLLKDRFGMVREPHHERKILNDIKIPPFVLSAVEGLREGLSTAC
jgi:hypothetical protein